MAKAKVTLTCSRCGSEFEWTKSCKSRKEADSAEEWALANVLVCPDCWKKAKQAKEQAAEDKKLNNIISVRELPELKGTEKQIAYAEILRERYLAKEEDHNRLAVILSGLLNGDYSYQPVMKLIDAGFSKEEAAKAVYDRYPTTHTMLTETDAGKIIEKYKETQVSKYNMY